MSSRAIIIFSFENKDVTVQCPKNIKMKDICQKYSQNIGHDIDSLYFLYEGNVINLESSFEDLVLPNDKVNNKIKILVSKKENEKNYCPFCNVKTELKTKEIEIINLSNNAIKKGINEIEKYIQKLIDNCYIESIKIQMKNVNYFLSSISEQVENYNKNLQKSLINITKYDNSKIDEKNVNLKNDKIDKENNRNKEKELNENQQKELEKKKRLEEEERKKKEQIQKRKKEEEEKKKIEQKRLEEEEKKKKEQIQKRLKEEEEKKKKEQKRLEEEERKKKEQKRLKEEEEKKKIEQKRIEEEEKKKKELLLKRLEEDKKKEQKKLEEEEKKKKEQIQKKLGEQGKKKKIEEMKKEEDAKTLEQTNNEKKKLDFDKLKKDQFDKPKLKYTMSSPNLGYACTCTNLMVLRQYIYVGTDFAEIPLMLKNDGLYDWPSGQTKLIFEKKFKIKGKNVVLNSIEPGQEQQCIVKIEGLGQLPVGEYETGVYFNINGFNCGNLMKMKINIIKKEGDPKIKYQELINQFRNEYTLSEEEYSDDDLYSILESNSFNLEKAFKCIIGEI